MTYQDLLTNPFYLLFQGRIYFQSMLVKFLFMLCFGFSGTFLSAQVPQGFSYQAVARSANGQCLSNQNISIRISLSDTAANSPILYQEQHISIPTNEQGLFSLNIGADPALATGAGQTTDFATLSWNNQQRWLKVEMDPSGGASFAHVGTQQLLTVPYAMIAGNGLQFSQTNQDEYLPWYGENGLRNGVLGGRGTPSNYGILTLYDDLEAIKARLSIRDASTGGYGRLELMGENGNLNFNFGTSGTRDHGNLSIYDPNGDTRVLLRSDNQWDGAGRIVTYGPNGASNVILSIQTSGTTVGKNRGAIRIYDENGVQQIYLGVDANGNGVLVKDAVNFIMDHPTLPNKDIVYACIEGPEAAAYERGTAELVHGEAEIRFSDHFAIVANSSTMTVVVTPRSPESQGLAAFEYSESGFRVKELHQGTGSYSFDWEVKAVRKGWEDYEVIREKVEDPGAGGIEEE